METKSTTASLGQISVILRGESEPISDWIRQWDVGRTALQIAVMVAGTSLYGAAMGSWRDPHQALYTAIKFPLIILLTTLGNALLNGMLAPLLGLNLAFRQSLQAILMSFMIAGTILGSFSPVVFFLVWNVPPMTAHATGIYAFVQLTHVVVIAFAGHIVESAAGAIVATVGRQQAAVGASCAAGLASRAIYCWGARLSWILRPFIGFSPGLPVEFLRSDAFGGNFYESVFHSLRQRFFSRDGCNSIQPRINHEMIINPTSSNNPVPPLIPSADPPPSLAKPATSNT